MKNIIKVAFLSSIITAAMVYVVLEWRPLRSETSRAPEVSFAAPSSLSVPEPSVAISDEEKNNIDIYQKYSSGVVNITTTTLGYDFFLRPVPMESGTGSGAIIDDQGHIVTNFHVVRDAQRLEVTLPDKTKQDAQVIGFDANNDLAVLKIKPQGRLTPIPLGTSKGLLVGQKVLAIGNPYGLERTLTTGIISSLGRSIQAENGRIIEDIIQTDAAINPGNSGGPLLNSQGQIIGINTAIYSPSGNSGSVGIGFAIPADTVRRITTDLITTGYVKHPWLGVRYSIPLMDYPGLANALRLNTEGGLLVVELQENSPAYRAGIRGATREVIIGYRRLPIGGDVILEFQGKPVNSAEELAAEADHYKPGDKVTVSVLRDNRKIDLPVVLQEAPRQ